MAESRMPNRDPQTEGLSDAAVAAFGQLRQRFVAGLPERWQEIAAAPAPLQQAALHRLAGAAGSYGLPALGEAAKKAELSLEQGRLPDLEPALQELERMIAAASVTNP
ncbi:Hpt domain-containing protein [Roseateles oligotrophus]|uniref:Hpt domain-containing protein n=1 Tax=Roseateles oligotrophus TaxID=1769250 RepID=A0ABT2YFZ2_9BURK|nr:Hpt domain-containing protein [Roseateles oligotrophus]MCV2368890.1 Hpt domain-containing protein [Roseateles oligotrophus]